LDVEFYKLSFQLDHLRTFLEVQVFADHSLKTTAFGKYKLITWYLYEIITNFYSL
jgi:hypothetical protein